MKRAPRGAAHEAPHEAPRERPRAPRFGAPVVTLRDGVELHAPGGAFLPRERALVVADAHAGYTRELRARGYAVPEGDDDARLGERIAALRARTGAETVVLAGDATHGPGASRLDDAGGSSLTRLVRAAAPAALVVVLGNHDARSARALRAAGARVCDELALGPHRVAHGDDAAQNARALREARALAGRLFVGHLHPALALDDGLGARALAPAFVSAAGLLVLPALAPLARGGDVRAPALHAQLLALSEGAPLGVAIVHEGNVLPLGDVFLR